jgi:hypothetical protein
MFRKDLDGDIALQTRITPSIHLAHTPRAEGADDLVKGQAVCQVEAPCLPL